MHPYQYPYIKCKCKFNKVRVYANMLDLFHFVQKSNVFVLFKMNAAFAVLIIFKLEYLAHS